jgi:LPXTG-motif cell wall-anchored protein
VAQLAYTGSTGLAGLGLGALALLLAGAALLLRRRTLADGSVEETGPIGPRRRR